LKIRAHNLAWLKDGSDRPDTAQFSYHDIAGRMEGGWAGWSSPTHFLAACETLGTTGRAGVAQQNAGLPELLWRLRHARGFHCLKNAARFENGTLSVNLHIDKLMPQAEIRGYQPFKGLLSIQLWQACAVRVRVPDFVETGDLAVEVNGAKVAAKVFGNYLDLGRAPKVTSSELLIRFHCDGRRGDRQPGFRHYRYR